MEVELVELLELAELAELVELVELAVSNVRLIWHHVITQLGLAYSLG